MAVLVFEKTPTIYHYPPRIDPAPTPDEPEVVATLCGIKPGRRSFPKVVEGDVPTNWQPCDACSEIDDHDQRFIGTF